MPQDPHLDPRTGQYHADPMWRRYQQPSKGLGDISREILAGLKPTPSPIEAPPSPPSPEGFRTQHVGAPNIPDGNEGIVNNDNVITSDSSLSATQALDGLKKVNVGSLPQGLDPFTKDATDLQTLRTNQLDEMSRNRERDPIGAGATVGDISRMQNDLDTDPNTGLKAQAMQHQATEALRSANQQGFSDTQEAARFGRNLETAKIQAPVDVAKITAGGLKDVAHINKDALAGNYDKLSSILTGGQLGAGTEIDLPGGGRIRTGPAMTGQSSKASGDLLAKKIELRRSLDNPGSVDKLQGWMSGAVPGMSSVDDRKHSLDTEIAELQRQLSGGGMSNTGGDPVRTQAIEELKKAGHPISEGNIQEVMRQLAGH